jgi:hypothetical protein
MPNSTQLVIEITADGKAAVRELHSIGKEAGDVSSKAQSVKAAWSSVNTTMLAVGAAGAAAVGAMYKASSDFGNEWTQVRNMLHMTKEEAAGLQQQMLRLDLRLNKANAQEACIRRSAVVFATAPMQCTL